MSGEKYIVFGDIRDQIMLFAVPCQFCPILSISAVIIQSSLINADILRTIIWCSKVWQ